MKLNHFYTSDFTVLGYIKKKQKCTETFTHKHLYFKQHYNGHNESQKMCEHQKPSSKFSWPATDPNNEKHTNAVQTTFMHTQHTSLWKHEANWRSRQQNSSNLDYKIVDHNINMVSMTKMKMRLDSSRWQTHSVYNRWPEADQTLTQTDMCETGKGSQSDRRVGPEDGAREQRGIRR